ncbi:MAG TPA: hypothetical protein VJH91_01535 [Candidatus Paceibacterota bacterium]
MLPYRDSRITKIALIVFFVVVIGYAYYEARGILFGPRITITSTVTEVHEPFIIIKGRADRISALSMNGKAISVTETGQFEEPYLLAEGLNRIILDAEDKYGRSRQETIQIVYTASASSTPMTPQLTATTSPTVTSEQQGAATASTSSPQAASSTTEIAPQTQ